MVYTILIGSKHKNKSLFQNLVVDITEVQTLRGIILLGGNFNAHIAALPDTIDTNNLCQLLQALEFTEIEQPNIVVKWQNCDASVSNWGHKVLGLCYDAGLFILNGRTPGDEPREFICLKIGGRNTIDYIVSSLIVW